LLFDSLWIFNSNKEIVKEKMYFHENWNRFHGPPLPTNLRPLEHVFIPSLIFIFSIPVSLFITFSTVKYRKIDIFTLGYFHSENNKTDCDVMCLIMTLCCVNALKPFRFETNMSRKQRKCNKQKIQWLMNMIFISLVKQDFYNIFTLASHSWKY
jgi:hypothetical protein